jgi:hypothetical protein
MPLEAAWDLSLYTAAALCWLPLVAPAAYLAFRWNAVAKRLAYLALTFALSWAIMLSLVCLLVPASLHWNPQLQYAIAREAQASPFLRLLESITGAVVTYWWAAVTFGGPLLVAFLALLFTFWLPRKPFFAAVKE